jgi:glycosyltransferase domain-containing protein
MKNKASNYNITVLLTIFNRLDFTKKWLDFAEKQQMPFKILISDGGSLKNVKDILNLEDRDLDIEYKKYKFYKNYRKLYEKYFFAIKNVKTDYVIICEDDDYINIDGIKKSVNFLKNNKGFSCVKGINLCGELSPERNIFNYLALRKEDKNFNNMGIYNDKSEDRLINYYRNNHLSIFNGLQKKSVLKKVFKVLNRDFYNLYITELIFVLIVINEGKIKRSNYIDYIKMDNTVFSSSENFAKYRLFSVISKSKKFHFENNLVLKYLNLKEKKNLFLNLHNNLIKKDKYFRLIEEEQRRKISRFIYNLFILLIKKIKLYAVFKNIIFFLKYKSICNKIYVKNKDIIYFLKKDKFFLKNVLNHNLQ